jgi:predicted phosphoadenosine phosphosulfate sulfurtransferase
MTTAMKRTATVTKRMLGVDVLTAARDRIRWTLDAFPRACVSFSGGKDSTVMLHLVMEEVIARGRKIGLLFLDLAILGARTFRVGGGSARRC